MTLRLRPRNAIPQPVKLETTAASPPAQRQYLTRAQLAADHGAAPEDIAKVEAFAQAHQLAVVATSEARASVWLSGTVAQMSCGLWRQAR